MRGRRNARLTLIGALAAVGCSLNHTPPQRLDIVVTLQGPSSVEVALTNRGSSRALVTETFGIEGSYLHLEIEEVVSGHRIPYPRDSQFELFSEPPARCLAPGKSTRMRIDLASWHHIYGGVVQSHQAIPEPGPHRFPLFDSDRYRIRAVYRPSGRLAGRCGEPAVLIFSEWILLDGWLPVNRPQADSPESGG
jgi:hypothetical protein